MTTIATGYQLIASWLDEHGGLKAVALYLKTATRWDLQVGMVDEDGEWSYSVPVILAPLARSSGAMRQRRDPLSGDTWWEFAYVDLSDVKHIIRCPNLAADASGEWS